MLSLTRIFLHNWHRFDHRMIEVEDSLYLAGANGTGKSSVLDAMQVVLIADLQKIRLNSSAQQGQERSERTLDTYVRGKIRRRPIAAVRQYRRVHRARIHRPDARLETDHRRLYRGG